MISMNRELSFDLLLIGTFLGFFGSLDGSIPIYDKNKNLEYEDTRTLYSVESLKRAKENSTFIKLAFVIDHHASTAYGENYTHIASHLQQSLTLTNSIFQEYNARIVLVDIILWNAGDKIQIDKNGTITFTRFEQYARSFMNNTNSIDHMVLILGKLNSSSYYFYPNENMDKMCKSSTGVIFANYTVYNRPLISTLLMLTLAYNMELKSTMECGQSIGLCLAATLFPLYNSAYTQTAARFLIIYFCVFLLMILTTCC